MVLEYFIEYNRYMNIIGIFTIIIIALLLSFHRKNIDWLLPLKALSLVIGLALLILKTSGGLWLFNGMANGVQALYSYAHYGIEFVFGPLGTPTPPWNFIFALHALPAIIFFGALMGILFHLGIIPAIIGFLSRFLQPFLRTSAPETLCALGNSFLGQTEAPLLIRPYLASMTESEIFVVMVSGMSTMTVTLLPLYAAWGIPLLHLLCSSIIAIPASLCIAKIIMPSTKTTPSQELPLEKITQKKNLFEVLAQGTSDGLQLALNVGAMLIAFISILAFLDHGLAWLGSVINYSDLSLSMIIGTLCAPFGYLAGFVGQEAIKLGELIGFKIVANEMIAFGAATKIALSPRLLILATYALAGFSNFSSIGIQIGGIGSLATNQKPTLSKLGIYAVIAGALTNLLCMFVVGLLL
jgi:CNT family concentrative nucleoside transporter